MSNLRDWIDETMENHGGGKFCPLPSATETKTSTSPSVASTTASKCKCGVKKSGRIAGGQEATVSFVFPIISLQFI